MPSTGSNSAPTQPTPSQTQQVSAAAPTSSESLKSDAATPQTEAFDPNATRIEAPNLSGDATQTWIERRDELEHTHSEETLKPQSVTTSQSLTRTLGTVVLRQRDVTQGVRGSGAAAEYEIGRRLGEGGMGAVYQTRQGAIDRTVALKVIKPGLKNASELKEKFVAEAVITGDLEHPGIVPIYDLGTNAAGDVFYAMKEVRGTSWKAVIDQKSEAENIDILMRVADAIAFAHSRGVIHRDFKPDNVMIGAFGDVRLLLADHTQAQAAFESAAELAQPLARSARRVDLKHAATLALITSHSKRAECLLRQGQYAAAEASVAAGLAQADHSEDRAVLAARGNLLLQRSQLQRQQGRLPAAAQDISQAQELFERVATSDGDATDAALRKECRVSMALSCDQLALLEEQLGQLDRAEKASQRAIAIWSDLYADAADVPLYLEGLASSHVLLSNIQRGVGRDSESSARQAIKAYEALVLARPEVPKYQFQLATELINLAYLQLRSGHVAAARALAIDATNKCVRLANEYPEFFDYSDADASSRSVLGEVLRDAGKYELAAGKLDEAIELFTERVAQFADVPSYRERLAESLNLRAQVAHLVADSSMSAHRGDLIAWLHLHSADDAWSRDDKEVAASHYQAAIKQRESLPKSADLQHHFGWLLTYGLAPESRQPQRAVEFFRQALASAPTNADYWFDLAFAQTQAGQWEDAARSVEQGQKNSTAPRGQEPLIRAVIEHHHDRAAAAEQLFLQGSDQFQKTAPGKPRLLRLQRLAKP